MPTLARWPRSSSVSPRTAPDDRTGVAGGPMSPTEPVQAGAGQGRDADRLVGRPGRCLCRRAPAPTTGFDWLLIDGEHAPNDLRAVLAQLQAMAPYPVASPSFAPGRAMPVLIKHISIPARRRLLVPMVDSAEQAATLVAATRYPPLGIRGVGSALAGHRAGRSTGYLPGRRRDLRAGSGRVRMLPWPTWRKSPRSTVSTACSSARPTSPPRWAFWATLATPRCWKRCRRRRDGAPAAGKAPGILMTETTSLRSTTWIRARCSSRSASRPTC